MFARIENGKVVELLDYESLDGRFHPDFVAQCRQCSSTVEVGWVWDGSAIVPPPGPSETDLAATVRAERDGLLAGCDFTQLPDAPLTPTEQVEWQVYRERLRDVPEQEGFPIAVVWPVKP